ncbi:MAG: RNA polymerase sigma factor [Candidatus Eisenbacteria bacterium]|uniref:RNA polymerase sigma factor n=1 Tax=Eiseniibacteriota bacterium TaxID=2212470 RepID=A0A538SUV8_UNCEI|nr:MAG: RNA polymerase sigma factor [Candidatus Eisenbacteria bacterium]TMQ64505.1 MAG: RNA polymerase sigma factor [Candidatus Eisenbacteria bacterium]
MTNSLQDRTQAPVSSVLDLEGVRRREPQALAAFFDQHFDRVYGLVYRLLGDRHWAEDATQEVFLKLHRAAHTLDPDRDPGPWVTTIAYNVCRDLWRSGAYRLSRNAISIDDPDHGDGAIPPNLKDPERELIASEREGLVQDAIGKLKEPLRAVVVLREYQGFTYEEIASLTGTSPVAARKRYSRALTELGKLLENTFE